MDFVAIDVETANPDFSSICQVGLARFKDGRLFDTWESLVDPEDDFSAMNVAVHGIDAQAVRGAPRWPAIFAECARQMGDAIVVSHTAFDHAALVRACAKHQLVVPAWRWLDSARVVRRAWPQFAASGWALRKITAHLGIRFEHHNAKEDARAAGEVLLQAIAVTGLDADAWTHRVLRPIDESRNQIASSGNPDGPLCGEVLVFTGALSLPRKEAAELAARAGCEVADGVTKHTTVLVVGDQDIRRLAGEERSAKHRKAEALIAKGQALRIIGESDFQRLVLLAAPTPSC